jgi:PEP-CTERM motif
MGTIGLRFSAWQCHLVVAAVLILFGSARAGAGGFQLGQTDFILTGAAIPGVGVPQVLVGLGPETAPQGWTGTVQSITDPFTFNLNSGNLSGIQFVHFGLNLLNNGVTTPVPLDINSFPDAPTPDQQPGGHFIGAFTAGNGEFQIHFDLSAPGGIVPQDFTYPAGLPSFPNALEFQFTQALSGVDPMLSGEFFGPNGSPIPFDRVPGTQTPEPSTLALLGLGVVGVVGGSWRHWRLRKKTGPKPDKRAA